jgi:hypothetical protein
MIHNVHQRELRTTEARLGELLGEIGGPADPFWPRRWPRLELDRPLGVGADGGHGRIRYTVTDYQPGRRVVFRFQTPTPFDGTHRFEVLPGSGPDTAVLRHVLEGRPLGVQGWLSWVLVIRWLHDACLEDLLERAARAVGDPPARPARWSAWVRLCRLLVSAREDARAA